ncbi:hypothetical protein P7H21_04990 [Paenibacillus larvae]|nr:hypothetical protein [Paenibacillus larvae]MDT2303515.1 hypothetical protein [Paenibacillus larvae]
MRSIHQSVKTTSSELHTLSEHTQQIDEIITAITAIAKQTQCSRSMLLLRQPEPVKQAGALPLSQRK